MALWDRNKRRRILIVEDDWAILEVLKLMLEHEGHVVVAAKHGRDAIAVAATKPFDMVLMDISMPEVSGIEVAQTLRASAQTADVLIAIHTGLDEHWVRERFDDYDLFLTKATDTDVLIDEIARLFAQPKATRARRVAAHEDQSFTPDELTAARRALREAMGLGAEAYDTARFVALLGDEIGQLRRIGHTDDRIAALIGGAIDRDVAPVSVERYVSTDDPAS